MFTLDDTFLDELGLTGLPANQRGAFLQHVYDELELRVGTALSDGLSDDQLTEFEALIDREDEVIVSWLEAHRPDFLSDPAFARLQAALPSDTSLTVVVGEYAATAWLEVNRPDYRDVVARTLDVLKHEIAQDRAAILGSDARV